MSVAVERLGGDRALVSVSAPLDYHLTQRLDESLTELLAEGVLNLAVDLSDATPVDDGAVGVLFDALRQVRPAGGMLALAVPDERLREVLGVMGLDRVFRVTPSREQARSLVAGEPA